LIIVVQVRKKINKVVFYQGAATGQGLLEVILVILEQG
jgi:hypothetical protein